jgi:integrase
MFNLSIDSKLRGRDVVALKVDDIAPHGYAVERATVRQKKTGLPVRFEVTEQTRQAVDDYMRAADKKPGEFLFAPPRRLGRGLSTRQYARLVGENDQHGLSANVLARRAGAVTEEEPPSRSQKLAAEIDLEDLLLFANRSLFVRRRHWPPVPCTLCALPRRSPADGA